MLRSSLAVHKTGQICENFGNQAATEDDKATAPVKLMLDWLEPCFETLSRRTSSAQGLVQLDQRSLARQGLRGEHRRRAPQEFCLLGNEEDSTCIKSQQTRIALLERFDVSNR